MPLYIYIYIFYAYTFQTLHLSMKNNMYVYIIYTCNLPSGGCVLYHGYFAIHKLASYKSSWSDVWHVKHTSISHANFCAGALLLGLKQWYLFTLASPWPIQQSLRVRSGKEEPSCFLCSFDGAKMDPRDKRNDPTDILILRCPQPFAPLHTLHTSRTANTNSMPSGTTLNIIKSFKWERMQSKLSTIWLRKPPNTPQKTLKSWSIKKTTHYLWHH